MSSTVTYKGATITTVSNETKTLETAGTWMEDDVTITDVSGGGGGSAVVSGVDAYIFPSGGTASINVEVNVSTGGYIGAGTYPATAAQTLPVIGNTTITPDETGQTIQSTGAYMDGDITINPIPSNYVGSGVTQNDSTDLTVHGATVDVPSGYYASNASATVASGTEGTPYLDLMMVGMNTMKVTPEVVNTGGYISGGTRTGNQMTISASDLTDGAKNITANGNNIDVINYRTVNVNVPGGVPSLQTKSATYTPTESTQTAAITPDVGYDGLDEVDITVNAISSSYVGSGITRRSSADLIVAGDTVTAPSGYYENSASASVTSNDFIITLTFNSNTLMFEPDRTYAEIDAAHTAGKNLVLYLDVQDPHLYSCGGWYNTEEGDEYDYWVEKTVEVSVNPIRYEYYTAGYKYDSNGLIEVGFGTLYDTSDATASAVTVGNGQVFYTSTGRSVGALPNRTSADLSASGATVTAPIGYYANAATYTISSGSEGTPSATKGAVVGNSVTVTPSVTNTAGYISGGTHTGTGVTVSASELVSGSETKTANGTYNVTNLASLVVAVPFSTIYSGSSTPSGSLGVDGDIYIQTGA